MKIRQNMRKIKNATIGATLGFSAGINLPIIVCTTFSYAIGKKLANLVGSEFDTIIGTWFGVPGLCTGCVIEGALIATLPGLVLLLASGVTFGIIMGIMMSDSY